MNKIYVILLAVIIISSTLTAALLVEVFTPTPNLIYSLVYIEQVSITNVAIPDNNTFQVLIHNSRQAPTSIATGFINGVEANFSILVSLPKNSSTLITFVQPINATFTMTPGNNYTIKLITSHGNTVVSAPITYNP
jgi:hypothetical protein